jgi:hypothetical protein
MKTEWGKGMTNTIVTSCNNQYLWGAILLISSIRLNNCQDPIIVWASQLSQANQQLLKQFSDVTLIETDNPCPHLIKPTAMLNVNTEYATWIDADCMFIGSIGEQLVPKNKGLHIRFREENENDMVFKSHFRKHEQVGAIPAHILGTWQRDVDGLSYPRHQQQCVTNFISIHRQHFGLIRKWKEQIDKILLQPEKPFDNSSTAYFMTDESILASLLIFDAQIPKIYDYCLNKDPHKKLIHFGQKLKPWNTWRFNHMRHYDYVIATIQALHDQDYALPKAPKSLDSRYRAQTLLKSIVKTSASRVKSAGTHIFSRILPTITFARD